MEPLRDEELIADLRALRPVPRPQFAAELDERAAAGFPRRSRLTALSTPPSWLSALRGRLGSLSPRGMLLPAGGVAFAVVVLTTAVIAFEQNDGGSDRSTVVSAAGREATATERPRRLNQFSGPAVEEVEPPSAEVQKQQGAMGTTEASSAAGVQDFDGGLSLDRNASLNPRHRRVERSAQIVLAAEPADVAEDSARVFEALRAHDGIVMRSSTRQGGPGDAGARFELLVPSANLSAALADLSAIDEVRSRREATDDITAPTVAVGELLQDSKARIDSLLGQLEEAGTETEREAVEAELRQERRHRARLRSQFQHLERRAQLSRVTLRIVTGGPDHSAGGGWGADEALGDAGRVLGIAAAVTLLALAVIAPIALIALFAWLAHRAWVRRERRRVLG